MTINDAIKEAQGSVYNGEALALIIDALDKQIPKKPDDEWSGTGHYFWCPYCDNSVDKDRDDYCPSCGQHILWEEEID